MGDGVWELCKVYSRPALRGGGMTARMLATAEEFARAQGGTRMKLWSDTRFIGRIGSTRSTPTCGSGRCGANDLSMSIEFEYDKPLVGTQVEKLDAAGAELAVPRLAALLKDCVDAGASVSFLPPLAPGAARGFWTGAASKAAMGGRVIFAGWVDGVLAGTVTLDLDMPPNQPHRADVAELLVHPSARRRGLARLLMERLEEEARAAGRKLLVLDTKAGDAGRAAVSLDGLDGGGDDPGLRHERRRVAVADDLLLEASLT